MVTKRDGGFWLPGRRFHSDEGPLQFSVWRLYFTPLAATLQTVDTASAGSPACAEDTPRDCGEVARPLSARLPVLKRPGSLKAPAGRGCTWVCEPPRGVSRKPVHKDGCSGAPLGSPAFSIRMEP